MASPSTDRRFGLNSSAAIKVPCRVATTANITLSGAQTIDGVACVTGDRVLVWMQTNGTQNGIWVVDSGAWSRAVDFNDRRDVTYGTIGIITGGTYQDQFYFLTTTSTITFGTTVITFAVGIPPLAVIAAASGSSLVGFIQAGAGAVAQTVQDDLRARITLEQFGAIGDGVANDAPALRLASAYAAANGAVIRVRAKTYRMVPSLARTDEAGSNLAVCDLISNLHIRADEGAVFKIADNISSDAVPVRMSMFLSVVPQSNISFSGLTFDMNGANNPISPARPAAYNLFTQAAILFSGTSGGIAARGDDVLIDHCTFKNTAGVTSIGCMQSNTVGVTLGKRWKITNCTFYNNGLDTNDHSSLYLWSEDILVSGCTFSNPAMWDNATRTGGLVAVEIHGARTRMVNCNVENYYQGAWVALNYTNTVDQVVVANNNLKICGIGVDFDRPNANSTLLDNILVDSNAIVITDDAVPITLKVGFQIAASYTVTNVRFSNNSVLKIGTVVASAFASVGPQTVASNTHDNIVFDGNTARYTTFGAFFGTNATNGLGSISVINCKFIDLTPAGVFAAPAGISGANLNPATAVKSLHIDGCEFIDTRAVPLYDHGIYLSGLITNLYVGPQSFIGMTVADLAEVGLTVTRRRGYFTNVSVVPAWKCGGVAVTIGNGSVQGQYTTKGQQTTYNARITVGSTTVFPGGTLTLDAPSTSAPTGIPYHGSGRIYDASSGLFYSLIPTLNGSLAVMDFQPNGAVHATASAPVVLATNDIVSAQITYNQE